MGDVIKTLTQLAFTAIILTVALEQIFDTNLFQKYLGKGLDGKGSKFLTSFDLRPWIATAVGIFLAFGFKMQAVKSGLGIADVEGFLGAEAEIVDMLLTGLIIGGGTKTIVKIAKRYGTTRSEIQAGVSGGGSASVQADPGG
ncbi:MAG: hypothetical protein E2O78_07180 [Caldithrix sp.]|nr:MAG: hypothetical protein E2O78_07180 [Caldithrix sp.]